MIAPAGVSQRVADGALTSPTIGAPGVYFVPAVPADYLSVEAMDVAGFVGVAPRGPAFETTTDPDVHEGAPFRARSVATPVDSWDDYLELFGGFEGPGLLPHAVSAYFAQGGRRAYVVRVVAGQHARSDPSDVPEGCARFLLRPDGDQAASSSLQVCARSEGSWGNRLRITVTYGARRLEATFAVLEDGEQRDRLRLPPGGLVALGSTIRVSGTGRAPIFRTVTALNHVGRDASATDDTVAVLDRAVGPLDDPAFAVVEADVRVTDADPLRGRDEHFQAVGLTDSHLRFLTRVLNEESRLVQVCDPVRQLSPPADLRSLTSSLEVDGEGRDRWELITPADLFGRSEEPESTGGIGVLGAAEEVATVLVPDLYSRGDLPAADEPTEVDSPGWFVRCPGRPGADAPRVPTRPGLDGLRLDPADPRDRVLIAARQQDLVAAMESLGRVVLLDVPPELTPAQVLAWRAEFHSMFAAAYHPWLQVSGAGGQPLLLPPSAMAAGVIARTELVHGLAHGPANQLVAGVVGLERVIGPQEHAELHRLGVNVFQIDPDGIRLTGARTLAPDPSWRQLSVRRLLTSIEKAVRRQLQWTVFEPNDSRLRDSLRRQLDGLMTSLFAQGCFAGSTPAESWFVQIASGEAARLEADGGQVLVQLGVAPSEPLEFIIVRVAVQAEGVIATSTLTGPGVSSGV